MPIENARIRATMLGYEDHGILTGGITVEGSGWGVTLGGFRLDSPPDNTPNVACGKFIKSVLRTVGVEKWEDLPGKFIRVETAGAGSTVTKFGHLIEDKWCDLREVFND